MRIVHKMLRVCVCARRSQDGRWMWVFPRLKNSLWHLRDNWHCSFFSYHLSLAPCSPSFSQEWPPLTSMKCSSQGCHLKGQMQRASEARKKQDGDPSIHLAASIETPNLTFNSISASTSYQSVRGSTSECVCVEKTERRRQKHRKDWDRKPLKINANTTNMNRPSSF